MLPRLTRDICLAFSDVTKYGIKKLRDEVARFAGVLTGLNVGSGDRVIIYMPMIPEAAIAMLACARIGAIHSVVFGGFAAKELATRVDDAKPKVILAASCGIEFANVIAYKPLIDEALRISEHEVAHCVVLQREQCRADMVKTRDRDWMQLRDAADRVEPVMVRGDHPLYVLYTSGTTGKPKGVVRDNGGHAVALNYSLKHIYNVTAGDVFWAAKGCRCRKKNINAILCNDSPEGACIRGSYRLTFKQHRCAACYQWAINNVGVASYPTHIGGTPVDFTLFVIENVFVSHRRLQ